MIILCEKCKTKYRIDEDKIPQREKFRVDCKKCHHNFVVTRTQPEEECEILPLTSELEFHEPSYVPKPGCQVISICNQKGGVAKTSSCINLAASLALLKKRVLVIDFDIQASLSLLLGFDNERSFFDVMHSGEGSISKFILNTRKDFWLLPSNNKMSLLSKKHLNEEKFEYLLKDKLKEVESHFDYIIIDTPPSGDFYTLNALMASDIAIIPTQCEFLSMNGVAHVEKLIEYIRKRSEHKISDRILVTMFDRKNTAAKAVLGNIQKKYRGKLLKTIIEYDQSMQVSQIIREPVIFYDAKSVSGKQYLNLAKEIIQSTVVVEDRKETVNERVSLQKA